jgi:hypothetical protein
MGGKVSSRRLYLATTELPKMSNEEIIAFVDKLILKDSNNSKYFDLIFYYTFFFIILISHRISQNGVINQCILKELLLAIFRMLPNRTLKAVQCVCVLWYKLSASLLPSFEVFHLNSIYFHNTNLRKRKSYIVI